MAGSAFLTFRRESTTSMSFWHDQRGVVALETALALAMVVFTFAGLAAIMGNIFETDRMERAARAAARVLSVDPGADACAVAHRELGQTRPAATADRPCGDWKVIVSTGVAPDALASVLKDGTVVAGEDEMVLVRVSSASGVGFGVSRSE